MWEEKLKIYDDLIARCPRFERKGKSVPSTTANGHMFSMLNKDGQIGIRFSKNRQKAYLEHYNTELFKAYNSVMQGYILITDKMLNNQANVVRLLNEAYDHVMSLDPK